MKTPKKIALKTFTIDDIRSWNPCYDPSKYLPENWVGTVIDILTHQSIPSQDKIWVVCREEILNAKTLRLFAVWCAKQVEHLMADERSRQAIIVAEQFALGNVTRKQLATAWDAAWDAVWDAARAASAAAWAAVAAAAWDAEDAAWAAAEDAARAATKAAARDAQVTQLLKMLEGI